MDRGWSARRGRPAVLALGEKNGRGEGRRDRVEEAERRPDASARAVEAAAVKAIGGREEG